MGVRAMGDIRMIDSDVFVCSYSKCGFVSHRMCGLGGVDGVVCLPSGGMHWICHWHDIVLHVATQLT